MTRWLGAARSVAGSGPPLRMETEEDLYVTATGQVTASLDNEMPSTWSIKSLSGLKPSRPKLADEMDVARLRGRVKEAVVALTRYWPADAPLNVRRFGTIRRDGYEIDQLVFDADKSCDYASQP